MREGRGFLHKIMLGIRGRSVAANPTDRENRRNADSQGARVEIYSRLLCPYCSRAKALLKSKGIAYQLIDVTWNRDREREMIERSRRHTVPQIFINGRSVGGYDDIALLDAKGALDRMLNADFENQGR